VWGEFRLARAEAKSRRPARSDFFAGWRAPHQSEARCGVNSASGGGAERQSSQSGPEGPRPQFEGGAYGVKFSSKKVRPSSRNFVSLRGKDFNQKAPPVGKRRVWLARYAGSPAVFKSSIVNKPCVQIMVKIAKAFGISIEDLL